MSNTCKKCAIEIAANKKFCSKSCAASYNNINRKLDDSSKEKISKKLSANYDIEIIKDLISEGKSAKEISEIIGVGKTTMSKIIKTHGLVLAKKKKQKPIVIKKFIDNETLCSRHNMKYVYNETKNIYECRGCNVEYVSNHRKRKKQLAIDYKGGKCIICGYSKCAAAMDFHHIDPSEKDFNISEKSISFENMKKELDKCVLLCSNCHREFHDGEIELPNIGELGESD